MQVLQLYSGRQQEGDLGLSFMCVCMCVRVFVCVQLVRLSLCVCVCVYVCVRACVACPAPRQDLVRTGWDPPTQGAISTSTSERAKCTRSMCTSAKIQGRGKGRPHMQRDFNFKKLTAEMVRLFSRVRLWLPPPPALQRDAALPWWVQFFLNPTKSKPCPDPPDIKISLRDLWAILSPTLVACWEVTTGVQVVHRSDRAQQAKSLLDDSATTALQDIINNNKNSH